MNTDKKLNYFRQGTPAYVMTRHFFLPLLFAIPVLACLSLFVLWNQWLPVEFLIIAFSLACLLLCLLLGYCSWKKLKTSLSGSTGILQDQRELEEKLRRRTLELELAYNDMESLSHSVSHDIRGSLRNIRGYTELLQEDYGTALEGDGLEYLSLIDNTTSRVNKLVDDLVSFSRLATHEVQRTEVNMHELTEEVWRELSATDIYSGQIKIQSLPKICADAVMMKLVLLNMLTNAMKFTTKKSQACIEVGASETTNEIIFYVKDNGAGFNMKYAHKLFTIFGRLHTVTDFEGTGVGLALVKRIILKHEGKIWAEGAEKQGACFYFSLPKKLSS